MKPHEVKPGHWYRSKKNGSRTVRVDTVECQYAYVSTWRSGARIGCTRISCRTLCRDYVREVPK